MKQLIVLTFTLSFLFNTACSSLSPYKVPVLQGNIIEDKEIEKLRPGLTKDQVLYILGTPLASSPLQSNRWDYFYSIKIGNQNFGERKLRLLYDSENLLDSWNLEDAIEE
tara:strand:+ start:614 stop:943 length:330 start_codon:yes stop_codon:yes gene_type:complete